MDKSHAKSILNNTQQILCGMFSVILLCIEKKIEYNKYANKFNSFLMLFDSLTNSQKLTINKNQLIFLYSKKSNYNNREFKYYGKNEIFRD